MSRIDNTLVGYQTQAEIISPIHPSERSTMALYPEIKIQLLGEDGNAFMIIGRCTKAMRKHGLDRKKIEEFHKEATSGDYDHLLRTVLKWFATPDESN